MLEMLGLTATAESVYRLMLAHSDRGVAELAVELGVAEKEVRSALDELFELSLLRDSVEHEGRFRAVDPQVGLSSLIDRQQVELDVTQRRIMQSRAAVADMVAEQAARLAEHRSVNAMVLKGIDAVQQGLERMVEQTSTDLLSLMPGAAQSAAALEAAYRNNAHLIERGVTIRTVMQDAARNDPDTLAYARSLTDAGAEVRTAPVLPPRMLIADRRIAMVPIDPDDTRSGAVQLTAPGLVASLLTLFEQAWSIAVPLGAAKVRDRKGVTAQEAALLKLLGQGHTDDSAAKRLGVSERTCRRMMSDLMERLGARSRFEAGLLAAREGWL